MTHLIRHIIQSAFSEVGGRIRYEGFGNSNYHSRDIKEAFSILQKAFLFSIIHPVTSTSLSLIPDTKKSPRLHSLDTGLIVFKTGVRKMLHASPNIIAIFSGKIVEHLVGQELFAVGNSPLDTVHFWARDKSQSNAEVDFVIRIEDKLIPVEVKSGANVRLRSLHAFLDASDNNIAMRLYSGSYSVETHQTIQGKSFQLVNVPVYHTSLVPKYLEKIL